MTFNGIHPISNNGTGKAPSGVHPDLTKVTAGSQPFEAAAVSESGTAGGGIAGLFRAAADRAARALHLASREEKEAEAENPYGVSVETLGQFRYEASRQAPMKFLMHDGTTVAGDYQGIYLKQIGRKRFEAVHIVGGETILHANVAECSPLEERSATQSYRAAKGDPDLAKLGLRTFFTPQKGEMPASERAYLQSQAGNAVDILNVHGEIQSATFLGLESVSNRPLFVLTGPQSGVPWREDWGSIAKYTFHPKTAS